MTTEQKKAIEYLENMRDNEKDLNKLGYVYGSEKIETVLNLVQVQEAELKRAELKRLDKEVQQYFETTIKQAQEFDGQLQRKDKIIDLMIEEYEYNARINLKNFCDDEIRKDKCKEDCKSCIKQFFERKVKDERK